MQAVLISIHPKWCELIASGKKTVEVRKTKPKLETPFKCYIYCTKGETIYLPRDIFGKESLNGKVIGEFVCDRIYDLRYLPKEYYGKPVGTFEQFICENSCLSCDDIKAYGKGKAVYGWHISELKIYDKPRELSEFSKYGFGRPVPLKRPPQSWMYVEVQK